MRRIEKEKDLSRAVQDEEDTGKDESRSVDGPDHQVTAQETHRNAIQEAFDDLVAAIPLPQDGLFQDR